MSIRHLLKATILITVFSIITRILGFVFRIYISRTLGAELLGLYQVAFSIFGVMLCMVSSGLPLTVSKLTAQYNAEGCSKKIGSMVFSGLIIGTILSVITFLLTIIFKSVLIDIFKSELVYYILLSLSPAVLFSSMYSVFRGSLWGAKKFFEVCITELFEQAVRMIGCFILVSGLFPGLHPALGASISLSAACFLSSIYAGVLYFKKFKNLSKPKGYFKPILSSATPITMLRMVSSLAAPLLSFILPLRLVAAGFTHAEALAGLGVIMGMTFPLLYLPGTLIGSLAMTLIPDISTTYKTDSEGTAKKVASSIRFTLLVSFVLIPVFIAVGESIGSIIFNNAESGRLLSSSAWIMVPMGVSGITSSVLNSLGLEVKSFRNYLVGGIFMIISIWFLPKFMGVYAITLGMGFLSVTASALNIKMINKALKKNVFEFKPAIILTALCAVTALTGKFIYNIFSGGKFEAVTGITAGIITEIMFLVLVTVFGFVNISSVVHKLKTKKSKLHNAKRNALSGSKI